MITEIVQIEKRAYDKIMTPKTFEWTRPSPKWPYIKLEMMSKDFTLGTSNFTALYDKGYHTGCEIKIDEVLCDRLLFDIHFGWFLVNPIQCNIGCAAVVQGWTFSIVFQL